MTALVQGFRSEDVKQPLEGFGVLVPSKERDFKTLGELWSRQSHVTPNDICERDDCRSASSWKLL